MFGQQIGHLTPECAVLGDHGGERFLQHLVLLIHAVELHLESFNLSREKTDIISP